MTEVEPYYETPMSRPTSETPGRGRETCWMVAGLMLIGLVGLLACGIGAFFLLGGPDLLPWKRDTPTVAVAATPAPTHTRVAPTAEVPQTETATPAMPPTPALTTEPTRVTPPPTPTTAPATVLPTTITPSTPTPTPSPTSALLPTDAPTATATSTPTPTVTPTSLPPVPKSMVLVPAGNFIQGSSEDEINAAMEMCADASGGTCPHARNWFTDETPRRTVYMDAFYIDRWEVTNQEFATFVATTGYVTDGEKRGESRTWRTFNTAGREKHPVVWMSWNDAAAYCRWAGKRLPTEAEWEKAARGTDGRIWPWGSNWESGRANTGDGGAGDVAAVGSYLNSASPYEVMDMTGNVWEWVADWYDPVWYSRSPTNNPSGPPSGASRVLRGGSFKNPSWEVRAVHRHSGGPDGYAPDHGFRCAK